LLPDPERHDYAQLSYESFLTERSRIIHKRMENLCDGNAV
jgi:hypothetical protein